MPIITTERLLDMNAFGRDELAALAQTGELVSATATRIEMRAYDQDGYEFRVIFTGVDLGGLTSAGFPTTGLITSFRLEQGGDLVLGIDGLSIEASVLNATWTTNDSNALWNLLYSGNDTVTGGDTWGRANTLFGHGGNDILNGGTGGDWLNGGAGDDIVYGGDETDPTSTTYGDGIDGAEGNDTLYGGAGRDVIVGGDGGDLIEGGDGNDILYHDGDGLTATDGFMTLQDSFGFSFTIPVRGFTADDRRAEDGAADTVNGGAGDDFIYLGVGDSADGGAGSDTVEVNFRGRNSALTLDMSTGSAAAVTAVSGGAFVSVERFDVVGTLFNDVITGGAEGSILYGEAGEDHVDGGGGNDSVTGSAFTNSSRINNVWASRFDDGQRDTLFGGEGNDGVSVGLLDVADGGAGTDSLLVTLDGMTQGVTLDLTAGDRFATIAAVTGGSYVNFETISALHTTEQDDLIRSLGVASIYTFGGDDTVFADDITNFIGLGDGDDLVYAMGGNDLVFGGFGNDRMYGGAGSDTLYADVDYDPTQAVGSGADFLDGGDGNDSLYGGAGNDVIVGGVGSDRIFGEAGMDTVSYQGSAAGVSIQAILTGYDTNGNPVYNYAVSGGDAQGDTLTSIEAVLGSETNDAITNFQQADGAGGADSIEGTGGADVLLGGAGDDTLRGLDGADTLNGGDGMDIAEYSRFLGGGAGSSVTVDLRIQGVAQNTGAAGSDTLISIEGVVGTFNADILHGDDQANYIQGAGDGIQPGSGPYQGDQLYGHGGDDVIVGDGAATGLGYTPGDGVSRGYDLISGGDGNDTITAGNGADVVNGDAGDDIIYGEWDNDTLDGGEGNDIIDGGSLDDTVRGGDGNDRLIGGSGDDLLYGDAGDDVLTGGAGKDRLDGGAGTDTASYRNDTAGVTVNFALSGAPQVAGSDTLISIERFEGSAFGDTITINASIGWPELITLGAGADHIAFTGAFVAPANGYSINVANFQGGQGGDVLDLSAWLNSGAFPGYVAGTDPFATGLFSFSEYDNGPNDYRIELNVRDANGAMRPFLTFRDVRISDLSSANVGFPLPFLRTDGAQNNDAMGGAADNDVMNGLGGFDQMAGFAGDDQLSGGDGDDIIFGDSWRANQVGAGDDVISGGAGADFLIGGGGDDVLDGGDGDDLLYGGVMTGGDTRFIPGYIGLVEIDHSKDSGADTFVGGAGNDRAYLVYSSATGAVVIDNSNAGNLNAIQIGGQAHGSITGVESVDIYGGSANDVLTAGAGADYLFGNAGDDILTGGGGDDILSGGSGADQLHGGAGIDVANYADATAGVTVDLALQGVAITTGGASGDILTGIEGLTGSAFSDVLRGDNGANILIDLLGGDDVIEGRGGDDVIGVDHSAEEFDDSQVLVDGGDGDDIIGVTGVGAGSTILGGAGRDDITLEYRTGAVTIDAGSGDDHVTLDMSQPGTTVTLGSGRDILTLTGSSAWTQTQTITDFTAGAQGDVIDLGDWTYQSLNPFAQPNTLRIIQSGADTLLQVWNGGWVNALVLQNVEASSLNAANFRGFNPHPSDYAQIAGTFESNTLTGTAGNDEIAGVAGSDALRGGAGDDIIVAGDPAYVQLAGWGSGLDGGAGDDVLRGAGANDVMVGNTGSDVLFGGRGNDVMTGGGGGFTSTAQTQSPFGQPMTVLVHGLITPTLDDGEIDYLYGEDGDDTLYAGRGDFAFGGSGTDRLVTSLAWRSSGVTLDLSSITSADLSTITDVTLSGFELFTLNLTAFNDTVTTGAGNDSLDGGDGDDILTGGAGLNTLTGGAGADTLSGGEGNDSLTAGQYGFSSLIQQSDGSYRSGGRLDDGAVDNVSGGDGNDSIFVGYGDIADGGAGTDNLSLTLIARTSGVNLDLTTDAQARLAAVQGGALTGFETFSSLYLTNFDDVLRTVSNGNFYAGAGNDAIYGNDLVQFMGGDEGDDRLEAFGGNDRLWGGAGDDVLLGGDGADVLEGDANNDNGLNPVTVGNDYLDGGAGIDTLNGGGGDDTLIGGVGNDTINGGVGTDTAIFNGARSAYTITVITGGAVRVVGPDGTDTLTGVERLRFNDGLYDNLGATRLNEIAGTTGADPLAGTSGIDVITAGDGDDVINAGDGDDLITGGAGRDIIDGGDGIDTLFVQGTRADTRVIVLADGFLLKSLDGGDRLVNVELIRFSDGGIIDLRIQSGPDGWGAFVDGQKGGDAPLILPSIGDKGIDNGPQVLPGADDFILIDDTSVPTGFAGKSFDDGPLVLPGADGFVGRPHLFAEDSGLIVMGRHGPMLLDVHTLHSDAPHDPWA